MYYSFLFALTSNIGGVWPLRSASHLYIVFIRINASGAMPFQKGGGGGGVDYYIYKNQLSSPVAMGDNGHLQP